MDALEAEQRARVVKEAITWLRTPYHHGARVKGVGVDCAMLSAETYQAARMVPRLAPDQYPPDWHLNRGQELYLKWVLRHATIIAGPGLSGDKVLFKFGRCFAHGGIIVQWPRIIHAFIGRPVQYDDAERSHQLKYMGEAGNRPRPRLFATLWPTEDQREREAELLHINGLPPREEA